MNATIILAVSFGVEVGMSIHAAMSGNILLASVTGGLSGMIMILAIGVATD